MTGYQKEYQASVHRDRLSRVQNLSKMTADELDAIIDRTHYVRNGVPLGDLAAADYALRKAVFAERGRRSGHQ